MFIEGICCRKSLFTLITSIHYITPPIPIFFPMTNLFFCRNIYNPNFLWLWCCSRLRSWLCGRCCRRLDRRSCCGFRGRCSRRFSRCRRLWRRGCRRLRGRLGSRRRCGFCRRCSCRFYGCCSRRLRGRAVAGRRLACGITAGAGLRCGRRFCGCTRLRYCATSRT